MNHVKTKKRNSLSGCCTENEMRILINTDRKIENFDALYFSKKWLEKGHMKSDDPSKIKRKNPKSIICI